MNRLTRFVPQAAGRLSRQLSSQSSKKSLPAKPFDNSLAHPLMQRDIKDIYWRINNFLDSQMVISNFNFLARAHFPHLQKWRDPNTNKTLLQLALKQNQPVVVGILSQQFTEQEVYAALTQRIQDAILEEEQEAYDAQIKKFQTQYPFGNDPAAVKQALKLLQQARPLIEK